MKPGIVSKSLAVVFIVACTVVVNSCSSDANTPPETRQTVETPKAAGVAQTYPHYVDRAVLVERRGMQIDDGDTFVYDGVTVRILGIDTPEIMHPEHGFYEDQPYGHEATDKATEIFDSASVIEYVADSLDPYGRTLAQVFVDGESFAVKMIEAGMAYESVSFYGDNGFPDIAALILAAAEKAGTPPFQEPHIWRREHRREPSGQSAN